MQGSPFSLSASPIRGLLKMEVGRRRDAGLNLIRDRFRKEKPLAGLRLSACLHVTSETANLAVTLKDGGADIVLCASNPLSTQDDVERRRWPASTASQPTPSRRGRGDLHKHINAALAHKPNLTMDDGADLVTVLHTRPARTAGVRAWRHRGDDDRRHPPEGDGEGRCPQVPGPRRQRLNDQALLRQTATAPARARSTA